VTRGRAVGPAFGNAPLRFATSVSVVRETDDELDRLAADALPPGTRIRVSHFFTHVGATDRELQAFLAGLREAGFGRPLDSDHTEISSDEELPGDGCWHHWAHSIFEADEATLREADGRARAVADEHGVEYDGWRVQRGRLDREGSPRIEA
jgi:hypothetical protein